MASQLSKKAALPLAKILATRRNNVSNTGPRKKNDHVMAGPHFVNKNCRGLQETRGTLVCDFCLSGSGIVNIDYCVVYCLCVVLDNKNIKNRSHHLVHNQLHHHIFGVEVDKAVIVNFPVSDFFYVAKLSAPFIYRVSIMLSWGGGNRIYILFPMIKKKQYASTG